MPRLLPRTEPTPGLRFLLPSQAREINRFLVAGLLTAGEANAARSGDLSLDWDDLRSQLAAARVEAPPSLATGSDGLLASLGADPLADSMLGEVTSTDVPASRPAMMRRLTVRQRRVLDLLAQGATVDLLAQGATVDQMMRVLAVSRASVYTYRCQAKRWVTAASGAAIPRRWAALCRADGRRIRYTVFAEDDEALPAHDTGAA